MSKTQELLTKISQLTRKIEEEHPELQKYLDETRMTIPQNDIDPKMDKEVLEDYLNSLNNLVEKYKK